MRTVPKRKPPDNGSAEFIEINDLDDLVLVVTHNMRKCAELLDDTAMGRGCCLHGGVCDRNGRLLEFSLSLEFTPTQQEHDHDKL